MTSTAHMEGIGIAIPQITSAGSLPRQLPGYLNRAEELGYESLWVSELTSAPILEPLSVLNYAAATTTRPRLGVAVLLTPLRVPYQLAQDLATLDQLSAGRLIVGVGLGSNAGIYPRYGLPTERRVTRYRDGLELIQALWTQEKVTFHNEWWHLDNVALGVRPAQRPHPPLWFGARRGKALRRAVGLGAGWIGSGSAPPDEFAHALETVRKHLDDLGRDPRTFTIAKRVYLHVTEHGERATERIRQWFAANYGDGELAHNVAVIGDAEYCAGQLHRLRQAGVATLILNPIIDERRQMELLAAEVIPRTRSSTR